MEVVELLEMVITRPGYGVLARGPVLAARGFKAIGAILGPVEVLPMDRVGLVAAGRLPSVWELEQGFSLGRSGCALIYAPLDSKEPWSVDRSLYKFKRNQLDYQQGMQNPSVRVILDGLR